MSYVVRSLFPSTAVAAAFLAAASALAAAPTPVDNTVGMLSQGFLPGTFPTTVTAANMKVEQFTPAILNGSGSNNLRVSFPAAGPIKWTESRHNEGDISLNIGPGNPSDPDYFPPTIFVDNYQPLSSGQPFAKTTIGWRVNQQTGAALATVNHNGVNYGSDYTFGGTPVGTIHGISYFNQTGASGYGYRMNDGEFANGGNGSTDLQMGIAGFDSSQGEASTSTAVAYFPYEQGWKGAWVNGATDGEGVFSASSPGLATSTVNWASGVATVQLPGVNSPTDGMLFVVPTNDDNNTDIAAAFPTGGGWKVAVREDDNNDFTGVTINTPGSPTANSSNSFQFLYVPYSAPRLIGGQVQGSDASLVHSAGDTFFDITRSAAGQYALSVYASDGQTKLTENDGMLILSVAGAVPDSTTLADRKFMSYQYNSGTGNFDIQSRELVATGQPIPPSENQFGDDLALRDVNYYFAWVSFTNPLAPILVGDYNNNGVVDAADYVVWRENENTTNVLPNDPLGGTIGADQYNQWRANFGSSASIAGSGAGGSATDSASASAAVPEPATLVLLIFAAVGWCIRRGREA